MARRRYCDICGKSAFHQTSSQIPWPEFKQPLLERFKIGRRADADYKDVDFCEEHLLKAVITYTEWMKSERRY